MSLSIGGSKGSSSSSNQPFVMGTGRSHIGYDDPNRRWVMQLDGSIRQLQDRALQKYASIYGKVGDSTSRFIKQSGSLRNKYLGNAGALMEARVNPIRERFATLRGQVQQDLGLRGLGGSTFGHSALRDIDTTAAREEGDARALATNESLNFESQLNEKELEAFNNKAMIMANIAGIPLEVAKARLAQEMAIFGIGSQSSGNSSMSGYTAKYETGFPKLF